MPKLIVLGSASADASGAISATITTGAISLPDDCLVYVYNNVGGTVAASGSVSNALPITQHTITASAGNGGTISPSGNVSVNNGASQNFTITANAGYAISDVKVDGTSKGAVSTFIFSNVTTNHTIAATFASTGGGGGTTPTDPTDPTDPTTPEKKPAPPVVAPDAPAKMTDTAGHWGKGAIDYVISRGLFAGTSENTFSPQHPNDPRNGLDGSGTTRRSGHQRRNQLVRSGADLGGGKRHF